MDTVAAKAVFLRMTAVSPGVHACNHAHVRGAILALSICIGAGVARADSVIEEPDLPPQLQLDLGLSVIGLGFEVPVGGTFAVQAEAFILRTYFLPWFGLGDDASGFGGGLRATWFARTDGRGLYVTPYSRVARVTGQGDAMGTGVAVEGGAMVGYVFRLFDKLDLRLGGGAQFIYIGGDPGLHTRTPFLAVDAVLGLRL